METQITLLLWSKVNLEYNTFGKGVVFKIDRRSSNLFWRSSKKLPKDTDFYWECFIIIIISTYYYVPLRLYTRHGKCKVILYGKQALGDNDLDKRESFTMADQSLGIMKCLHDA